MTLRTRAAGKIAALGAWMHTVLLDLSLAIEPRLGRRVVSEFRPRPALGLLVLVLLALGVATAGYGGFVVVRELLPSQHREEQAQ